MKREAMTHPKMQTLALRLRKKNSRVLARGILEGLWHLAGQHAPDGNLSRFTPAEIAEFIGWEDDSEALVQVLVETRWLDSNGQHLVIHHWHEHADGSVHKKLARAGRFFVTGEPPTLSYLGGPNSSERAKAEAFYATVEVPRKFRGSSMESSQSLAPPEQEPRQDPKTTAAAASPRPVCPRSRSNDYSAAFEEAWKLYPKRDGDNPKRRAWKAWNARVRDGTTADEMTDGVRRYAAWCRAHGKEGAETVKQAATFFGPDLAFREAWMVNPNQPGGTNGRWRDQAEERGASRAAAKIGSGGQDRYAADAERAARRLRDTRPA